MSTEVVDRLARIETKLDAALKTKDDHETRLRSVERKQWLYAGGVAAVSAYLSRFGISLPH